MADYETIAQRQAVEYLRRIGHALETQTMCLVYDEYPTGHTTSLGLRHLSVPSNRGATETRKSLLKALDFWGWERYDLVDGSVEYRHRWLGSMYVPNYDVDGSRWKHEIVARMRSNQLETNLVHNQKGCTLVLQIVDERKMGEEERKGIRDSLRVCKFEEAGDLIKDDEMSSLYWSDVITGAPHTCKIGAGDPYFYHKSPHAAQFMPSEWARSLPVMPVFRAPAPELTSEDMRLFGGVGEEGVGVLDVDEEMDVTHEDVPTHAYATRARRTVLLDGIDA